MERRRRWASSGPMPPALASRFTLAEQAVLAVVAAEVVKHGACTLPISNVAALAGVSETTGQYRKFRVWVGLLIPFRPWLV
jgi:hypothetical protein